MYILNHLFTTLSYVDHEYLVSFFIQVEFMYSKLFKKKKKLFFIDKIPQLYEFIPMISCGTY